MDNNYDNIWEKYIQAEEEAVQDIIKPGYLPDADPYADPDADPDPDADQDADQDDIEDEFDMFEERQPEFGVSFKQIQHLSYGDPEIGGRIGTGKMSKFERMIQQQNVSKEKLYMNRFRPVLLERFSMEKTNYFAQITEKLPRFWLKNMDLLASTFYMIDELGQNKLTANLLENYSKKTHNKSIDMYRYYKLILKYI